MKLDITTLLYRIKENITAVENGEDGEGIADRQGEDMGEELSL